MVTEHEVRAVQSAIDAGGGDVPNATGYESSEWEARATRCSRRLVSAVIFREMAQDAWEMTESPLLPRIGFYYAMFHMSAALLYLDTETTLKQLGGLRHEFLDTQVTQRLVRYSRVPESYSELLLELRDDRNAANYGVGGKLPIDDRLYVNSLPLRYEQTGNAFAQALEYLSDLASRVSLPEYGPTVLDRIRVTIGDNIGDDMIALHVPPRRRDRVRQFLQDQNLTT